MTAADAPPPPPGDRVLVLVGGPRDAELTRTMLARAGFGASICSDVGQVCAQAEEAAGAVLLAEEVLTPQTLAALRVTLARQPAWSDLPILVFGGGTTPVEGGADGTIARALGNVTFLDRPVRARSLAAAVKVALRSRRRQYEARQAIEARDTFLAMLGHELRNPLAAIAMAVALLERKSNGQGSKEHSVIARQSAHLGRLVDDLLDMARVTHGKVVLQREAMELVEVVRTACEGVEERAKALQIALHFRAEVPSAWVEGDRHRLTQVFGNLLTNALKYTLAGGRVDVSLSASEGAILVEVADTGFGLPPEMLVRIFDVFAQVEQSSARSQGGLGLGLALVRSIVELHGGRVQATSPGLGKGSTFQVRLPRRILHGAVVEAPTESLDDAPSRRVVVVIDDNEDMRELLTTMLRNDGHDVECGVDGPSGLDCILRTRPDIAFVDVGLPGFDGLEVARRVRRTGAAVTLVAVSGYGRADDRARAAEAGFDMHLTKPVVETDIERAMRRA